MRHPHCVAPEIITVDTAGQTSQYKLPSDSGGASTSGCPGLLCATPIENNIIELVVNIHPSGYGPPTGIRLEASDYGKVYTYLQNVIRGNVIRMADNATDPSNFPVGVSLFSCDNALIESNVIDLSFNQINFNNSARNVQCFNNANSAGSLVLGLNQSTNQFTNEIATRIEEAICLSL